MRVASAALATGTFLSVGLITPSAQAAEIGSRATYVLNIDGHHTTLQEGQSVTYEMELINPSIPPGQFSTQAVYDDNGGTITVTAKGGVYHYDIAMKVPVTNFSGTFYTTDITSGLSGGGVSLNKFAGDVTTSKLRGHLYSGSLTGTAYLLGVPIAKAILNNTYYRYNDY